MCGMAIKQIRQIPSDLPAAHLFLDDVEEITQIIANLKGSGVSKPDPSTIKYTVGDRECDTVADLKKIGGKTKKFVIEAPTGFLILGDRSVFYAAFVSEEAWEAYGKVKAIFDHRSSRMLNALSNARLPVAPLFIFAWTLPLFGLALLKVRTANLYLSEIVWLVLMLAVWSLVVNKQSVVELRYFDEAKHERFKEMRPAIWAAVISAILGGVVTVLGERIIKWLWP